MSEYNEDIFEYSLLNEASNEIRLVRLHPSPHKTHPLNCSLQHVPLSNPFHYEVLSYTLGCSTKTHSITISGKAFLVTNNLYTALRAHRKEDRDYLVWIDAMCLYTDQHGAECHQYLRVKPLFSGGFRFIK